jgi:hypothetical protein
MSDKLNVCELYLRIFNLKARRLVSMYFAQNRVIPDLSTKCELPKGARSCLINSNSPHFKLGNHWSSQQLFCLEGLGMSYEAVALTMNI